MSEDRLIFNIRLNRVVNICALVGTIGSATFLGASKANSILVAIQENTRQTMELRKEMDAVKSEVNEHDKQIAILTYKKK
jgi:hypothetical protein